MLGLLLPGVLVHTTSWLFNDPTLLEPNVTVFPYLPVANAVLFCAALYASTVSANGLRALLGTVVLFIAGAVVMHFANYLAGSHPQDPYPVYPGLDYEPVPAMPKWIHRQIGRAHV